MVKIANIVTSSRKNRFGDEFNVVSSCCDAIDGIPTLIIGVDEARTCIIGFNVLEKRYDDGMLWWTYKKTERKCDYDDDVEAFIRFSFEHFKKSVRYEYVDIVNYPLSRLKKLVKYMDSPEKKKLLTSQNGDFLFVYSEKYGIVFGISLSLCEYCGIARDKVLKRATRNRSNRFCKPLSSAGLQIRNIIGNDTHCLLPLL